MTTIKIKIINEKKTLKPILKWAGGKTQILNIIFTHFPKNITDYYEPFCGGGSIFIELINKIEKNEINVNGSININDINEYLIKMYSSVKNNVNELLKCLKIIKTLYNSSTDVVYEKRHKYEIDVNLSNDELIKKGKSYIYYYYRELFNNNNNNDNDNEIQKCAIFIFLNKTCFRGLYRESKNGFNVPYGNYKNPSIYKKNEILSLHRAFNKYNFTFTNINYDLFLKPEEFKENSFIYIDPPYYPLNEKSFVSYNKDGFSVKDNEKLANICFSFSKNDIQFIHSNSYCDYNVNMYKNYKCEKILCKRSINSKNPKSTANEILIISV
jgi:DNA adenine methylase